MALNTNNTTNKAVSSRDTPIQFDPDIGGAGLVVNLDGAIADSMQNSGATTALTGEGVETWTDQKNSLVFTSMGASRPPKSNSGLNFTGVEYLETPIFAGLNLVSAMSIFVVATARDITNPAFAGMVSHSNFLDGYLFRYGSGPAGELRFNFPTVQDVSVNLVSFVNNTRAVMGVVFGAAAFDYRKNGVQLGTTKSPISNAVSSVSTTIIGADEAGNENWDGEINQILIYNTKLTGANLTAVEDGLIAKWQYAS